MATTETLVSHVQHKRQQHQHHTHKRNILKEYANLKIDQTVGYLSFFSTVWFMLFPIVAIIFVLSYFGFVHGIAFITVGFVYNYLEDKIHPKGLVGRKWKQFHDFMGYQWEPFKKMMPIEVIKTTPDVFQPPRNNFDRGRIFPGLQCFHLMSSVVFMCPIFRQYCIWNGCIPATKESAHTAVNEHGASLSVIPGGLAEMLQSDSTPRYLHEFDADAPINSNPKDDGGLKKTIVLYLKARKGFIKLALQLGLDLVPVFTFGEIDTYRQLRWGLKWRLKLSRFLTIPVTWIWGKYLPKCTKQVRHFVARLSTYKYGPGHW